MKGLRLVGFVVVVWGLAGGATSAQYTLPSVQETRVVPEAEWQARQQTQAWWRIQMAKQVTEQARVHAVWTAEIQRLNAELKRIGVAAYMAKYAAPPRPTTTPRPTR